MIEQKENKGLKVADLKDGVPYIINDGLKDLEVIKQGNLMHVTHKDVNFKHSYDLKPVFEKLSSDRGFNADRLEGLVFEELTLGNIALIDELVYATVSRNARIPKKYTGLVAHGNAEEFFKKNDEPVSATVKAYKVEMNETESRYFEPRGEYVAHITADNEQHLKERVKTYLSGELASFEEKSMANPLMKIVDMVDGVDYEVIALTDYTNDIVIFSKEGETFKAIVRGGEFEEDWVNSYNLRKVLDIFYKEDIMDEVPFEELTLEDLQSIDCTITNEATAFKELPKKYEGIAMSL